MSKNQKYVGEHAEYYRRRLIQDVVGDSNSTIRELQYLRQKVTELEKEIAQYKQENMRLREELNQNPIIRYLRMLFRT